MSQEKEYFGGYGGQIEDEHHSSTIPPLTAWLVVIGFILVGVLYASRVQAEPLLEAKVQDVRVVLYTDECRLKDIVDLGNRATWQQGTETFEGCFAYVSELEAFVFYFKEDKSLAVIPAQMFTKVTNI